MCVLMLHDGVVASVWRSLGYVQKALDVLFDSLVHQVRHAPTLILSTSPCLRAHDNYARDHTLLSLTHTHAHAHTPVPSPFTPRRYKQRRSVCTPRARSRKHLHCAWGRVCACPRQLREYRVYRH